MEHQNNSQFQLFFLKEGETLKGKAAELEAKGVELVSLATIEKWIKDHSEIFSQGPLVIADTTVRPTVYHTDPPLIQVPACAIDRGHLFSNGMIDFEVPMWPKEAGGQLALLGKVVS